MKIGVFDSGIGGLSICKEIRERLPDEEIIYYADSEYCPYGGRTDQEVQQRCSFITEKLLDLGVELIVVACNTATAMAINQLRESYRVPFVGVEPYLNYINALEKTDRKCVALVTEATASSKRFRELKEKVDRAGRVDVYPCPRLAQAIEKGEVSSEFLEEELGTLKSRGFSHAILGCTHYSLIEEQISNTLNLKCISPSKAVAKRVSELASDFSRGQKGGVQFLPMESRKFLQEKWNVFFS